MFSLTSTSTSHSTLSAQLVPVGHSRDTAHPLPSVLHNGHQYVVAEQGVEFEIKVKIGNSSPGQLYEVSARIDGQCVGYNKITQEHNSNCSTTLRGWLYAEGGEQVYRAFRLGQCRPSVNATTVEHPDHIEAGKIVIHCQEIMPMGPKTTGPSTAHGVKGHSTAESKKLPEGKKWFLQPGLKAEAGRVTQVVKAWDTTVYLPVRSLPSLTIKYDTAENLKLRNILKPSNPQHAAILLNSGSTRVAALLAAQRRGSGTARKQQQQQKSSSRRRGVKRERDQHDEDEEEDYGDSNDDEDDVRIPASATGQVVNLCDEDQPGPLKVNGRALKTDELAVCDLCDSDDDDDGGGGRRNRLGKWRIKKKPAITIR